MKQLISNNVYMEVLEVLKYKKEIANQIPRDVLEFIYQKASNSGCKFEYETSDDILNQISTEAFCLYLTLYMKYVANGEEVKKIKTLLMENEIKYKNS